MTAVNTSARQAADRRASLMADGALAAALAVILPVATYFAAHHQPGHRPVDAGAIALVIASAGALALRRRYPVAVLAFVFGITLTYFVFGYADGPIWLPLVIAYYTAATQGHLLAAGIAAVAGFAVFPWLDYLLRNKPAPSVAAMAALAAWLLIVLGAGEAMRIRRERAARIREEESRRQASEERLRMARELHDSLGHYLSLISVQSGVALNLNQQLPKQARASLAAVKQASKEALRELRSVLDVLRQDGEPAPRSPAPGLARLGDLISQASAAGHGHPDAGHRRTGRHPADHRRPAAGGCPGGDPDHVRARRVRVRGHPVRGQRVPSQGHRARRAGASCPGSGQWRRPAVPQRHPPADRRVRRAGQTASGPRGP